MPYRLRKAPRRDAYWVVGEDGKKHSNEPLPLARAKKQLTALNIAHAQKLRGGAQLSPEQLNRMYIIADWVMLQRPFGGVGANAPTLQETVDAAQFVRINNQGDVIGNLENAIMGRHQNQTYEWQSHLRDDALYINHLLGVEEEAGHPIVPPDDGDGGGGGGGGGGEDADPGGGGGGVVVVGRGVRIKGKGKGSRKGLVGGSLIDDLNECVRFIEQLEYQLAHVQTQEDRDRINRGWLRWNERKEAILRAILSRPSQFENRRTAPQPPPRGGEGNEEN